VAKETVVAYDEAISSMGYTQRLDRSLSHFALFALQYSYLSVLTGIFELFGFGYSFGGPAMVWAWGAIFVGQFLLVLLFCELASEYPVAGSVYNWAKQLGGRSSAWMAGWLVLFTSITTVAAVALAAQIILPQISSGFQFIGSGSNPVNYAENAVLLGSVMIVATTIINSFRVRVVGFVNNLTVLAEIFVCVLLIVMLFFHTHHSPSVLFKTLGAGKGGSFGYLGAALAASFIGAYQFYGFDTAGSLAEETKDPHRRAPSAIMRAVVATFILGFFLIVAAEMAIPSLTSSNLAVGGLPYIVDQVLGSTVGNIMLVGVLIAVFGCTLAIQAAGTRMAFGMARDSQLPFSHQVAKVSGTTKAIVIPTIVVGAIAILILLVNVKSPQVISIVTSIAIVTNSIAYLCVSVPMLQRRLKKQWPLARTVDSPRRFSLGKAGLPINILAVIWGVALTVNLLWPRRSVYNATAPFHWYLQYGPILFTAVLCAIGFIYYVAFARKNVTVLEEHRFDQVSLATLIREEVGNEHQGDVQTT